MDNFVYILYKPHAYPTRFWSKAMYVDKLIASDERIGRDTPLDITTSPAVSQEGEMIKIAARRAYERMGQQD